MRLPSGQPEWQNGMPQSMQRAPCSWSAACGSRTTNSWKSSTRWGTGRFCGPTRWIFRKPRSAPAVREHLLLGLLLDLRLLGLVRTGVPRGLAGALGRLGGILLLTGLARLARLHPVAALRVRRGLAGAHGSGAVTVAVLCDHRRLARLDRHLLRALAQHALVVHRHDLHPGVAQRVPSREHALGHGGARAL